MKTLPYGGATFRDTQISEQGRQFVLSLLRSAAPPSARHAVRRVGHHVVPARPRRGPPARPPGPTPFSTSSTQIAQRVDRVRTQSRTDSPLHPSATAWTRICPRFGLSETVSRLVASASSAPRCPRSPRRSARRFPRWPSWRRRRSACARPTSSLSLRPGRRRARPSWRGQRAGADRLASQQRAEHGRAERYRRCIFAWTPDRFRAARPVPRAAAGVQARALFGELAPHLVDGLVARLALRVLDADAEVALRFSRPRRQLQPAVAQQIQRLASRQPGGERLLPGGVVLRHRRRLGSSANDAPSAGAVSRSAGATSRSPAPAQSTATAPSPIGAAAITSRFR